jgi:hypothetical protein
MRRFAVADEPNPVASPFDCPKSDELKFPMGTARFTLLKIFRAETLNVRL